MKPMPPLTEDELYILRLVGNGADVRDRTLALSLRTLDRARPGLLVITEPMGDGVREARPYLGAKLTPRGKRLVGASVFDLVYEEALDAAKEAADYEMPAEDLADYLTDLKEHHRAADRLAVALGLDPLDAPNITDLTDQVIARLGEPAPQALDFYALRDRVAEAARNGGHYTVLASELLPFLEELGDYYDADPPDDDIEGDNP